MSKHKRKPAVEGRATQRYIEQLLESGDKSARLRGLGLAVESPQYQYLRQAMALTRTPDEEVAEYARRVSVYLAETYLMDPKLQVGGLRLLWAKLAIKKYSPDFVVRAYQNLQSTEPDVIIAGLCGVRHFIDDDESLRILEHFINHHDERVRATACTQLGLRASRARSSVLMEFVQDQDSRVKANVIEMMEEVHNPEFIPFFTRFRTDPNNRVRANALKALHNSGIGDLENDFRQMLVHADPLMRASAVWAIGEIGRNEDQYSRLLKLVVEDPETLVQQNLVVACAKSYDIRNLKFLKRALLKKHPHLRTEPAFAPWWGAKKSAGGKRQG